MIGITVQIIGITVQIIGISVQIIGIGVQIVGIGVQIVGIGVFFVEIDDLEQLFIFIGIRSCHGGLCECALLAAVIDQLAYPVDEHAEILALSASNEVLKHLIQIPGYGPVTSSAFVSVLGDGR